MSDDPDYPYLLDYLPSCYREHGMAPGPLHAVLHIAGKVFGDIGGIVDEIETFFDPDTTPALPWQGRDFLSWLASWVGLVPDELWSEEKKRFLIKNAADFYRYRGTAEGLKYMVESFFDIRVDIEEWSWPAGMVIGSRSSIGIDTRLLGRTDKKHCFTVTLRPSGEINDNLLRKIRRVIDLEKPAHTQCWLEVDKPAAETEVSEMKPMVIGTTSVIGSCFLSREAQDGGRLQTA